MTTCMFADVLLVTYYCMVFYFINAFIVRCLQIQYSNDYLYVHCCVVFYVQTHTNMRIFHTWLYEDRENNTA